MTQWRAVRGFEGVYDVSDDGRVRRIAPGPLTKPGRMLKPRPSRKGYVRVVLHDCGRKRETGIHRLVAEAFLPLPPSEQDQVNHRDGDKGNNRLSNLEWSTGGENMAHSYRAGLHSQVGERNGHAKLTAESVVQIRSSLEPGRIIAERYGVSKSLIGAVRRGEVWSEGAS